MVSIAVNGTLVETDTTWETCDTSPAPPSPTAVENAPQDTAVDSTAAPPANSPLPLQRRLLQSASTASFHLTSSSFARCLLGPQTSTR